MQIESCRYSGQLPRILRISLATSTIYIWRIFQHYFKYASFMPILIRIQKQEHCSAYDSTWILWHFIGIFASCFSILHRLMCITCKYGSNWVAHFFLPCRRHFDHTCWWSALHIRRFCHGYFNIHRIQVAITTIAERWSQRACRLQSQTASPRGWLINLFV